MRALERDPLLLVAAGSADVSDSYAAGHSCRA
jgi:hypothetical protein